MENMKLDPYFTQYTQKSIQDVLWTKMDNTKAFSIKYRLSL